MESSLSFPSESPGSVGVVNTDPSWTLAAATDLSGVPV